MRRLRLRLRLRLRPRPRGFVGSDGLLAACTDGVEPELVVAIAPQSLRGRGVDSEREPSLATILLAKRDPHSVLSDAPYGVGIRLEKPASCARADPDHRLLIGHGGV